MSNTNIQTIHQMGNAITNVMKQAMGRYNVQNIDMDFVTVAQRKRLVEEIITGNPVTFVTNIEGPLDYLIAQINPVQDLHGYDAPWFGGAGKNLLPMTLAGLKNEVGSGTWNGNTYTHNGIAYTVMLDSDGNVTGISANGTASNFSFIRLGSVSSLNGSYILNGGKNGNEYIYIRNETSNIEVARTTTTADVSVSLTSSSDNIKTILGIDASTTVSNVVFKPMIRLSSVTDATFEPYSNICPISGWDSVQITRTGKNLLIAEGFAWANGTGKRSSDPFSISSPDLIATEPGAKFTFYRNQTLGANLSLVTRLYDENRSYIGNGSTMSSNQTGSITVTIPNNAYFATFTQFGAVGVAGLQVQVERGDSFTGYNAPDGDINSINFPTPPGTVYGGTLTVNKDGSGTLVVDRIMRSFDGTDSTGWRIISDGTQFGNNYFLYSEPDYVYKQYDAETYISNSWPHVELRTYNTNCGYDITTSASSSGLCFRYAIDNSLTVDDLMTYFTDNPLQILIPITEPETYTISAEAITTLLGENNIWADTGDVTVLSKNYEEVI